MSDVALGPEIKVSGRAAIDGCTVPPLRAPAATIAESSTIHSAIGQQRSLAAALRLAMVEHDGAGFGDGADAGVETPSHAAMAVLSSPSSRSSSSPSGARSLGNSAGTGGTGRQPVTQPRPPGRQLRRGAPGPRGPGSPRARSPKRADQVARPLVRRWNRQSLHPGDRSSARARRGGPTDSVRDVTHHGSSGTSRFHQSRKNSLATAVRSRAEVGGVQARPAVRAGRPGGASRTNRDHVRPPRLIGPRQPTESDGCTPQHASPTPSCQ